MSFKFFSLNKLIDFGGDKSKGNILRGFAFGHAALQIDEKFDNWLNQYKIEYIHRSIALLKAEIENQGQIKRSGCLVLCIKLIEHLELRGINIPDFYIQLCEYCRKEFLNMGVGVPSNYLDLFFNEVDFPFLSESSQFIYNNNLDCIIINDGEDLIRLLDDIYTSYNNCQEKGNAVFFVYKLIGCLKLNKNIRYTVSELLSIRLFVNKLERSGELFLLSSIYEILHLFDDPVYSQFSDYLNIKLPVQVKDMQKVVVIRPHKFGAKATDFDQLYLSACISSVLNNTSEDIDVVVIVDNVKKLPCVNLKRLHYYCFDDLLSPEYVEFVCKYKHFSTNYADFEMFSIASYFFIDVFLKLSNINNAWIVEGDTLLLESPVNIDININSDSYLSNNQTCCFAKVSSPLISHYCKVVLNCYNSRHIVDYFESIYQSMRNSVAGGGINDMTFWDWILNNHYNFNEGWRWSRCDLLVSNNICDHFYSKFDASYKLDRNIPIDFEFLTVEHTCLVDDKIVKLNGKNIVFLNNESSGFHPFYSSADGRLIRVCSSQFGGIYKYVMVEYWKQWVSQCYYVDYTNINKEILPTVRAS